MQPFRPGTCKYFGFLFLLYCTVPNETSTFKTNPNKFVAEYQWSYLNFTWPSEEEYQNAIATQKYIPENNVATGINFYKEYLYIALPRLRPGTPVTLAQVSTQTPNKTNPLLTPFPSWDMNVQIDCETLQNVQGFEIDRSGIMWVLDGTRIINENGCPPKLVLLDLNNGGKVVLTYNFRNETSLTEGAFLNDVVFDETDGGYAYITDQSSIDPGLIVYSRQQGRAWKMRDRTMFAEIDAENFTVDGTKVSSLSSIDGIGLSPLPKTGDGERIVYYTALNSKTIYSLSTNILKDEALGRNERWRQDVKFVGRRTSPSDGLIIDNKGNMYFGLISEYAVEKWNIFKKFSTARIIDENRKEFIWIDGFTMDDLGNLYLMANGIQKFFDPTTPLVLSEEIKIRIMKLYTGNKNYLFSDT